MPHSKPANTARFSFLLDENVDIRVASFLEKSGYPVVLCPKGLNDDQVLTLAGKNSRVLVTLDKDFADTDLHPPSETTGIIVLRIHPPKLKSIQVALKNLLDAVSADKFPKTLFVVTESGAEINH